MFFFKKENEILPKDVLKKLEEDFTTLQERSLVKENLEVIFKKKWNLGSEQLVRSVVFLVGGNLYKIKEYSRP